MQFYLTALLLGFAFVPLAVGLFFSVKIFNIPDITTDGSFTIGAAITAVLSINHIHPFVVIIIAVIGGFLAGSITAIIHTKLKINALLSGILVMTALYSVNLLIMGRSTIPLIGITNLFTLFSSDNLFYSLLITGLISVLILLLSNWLLKTDFGLTMRATGSNEAMIKAQGVNTDRIKIIGLALSNSLVALSGSLVTQIQGFADINMGIGIVIAGLASVMMGDAFASRFKNAGIRTNLIMVFVGAVLFRIMLAFVLSQGIDQVYLKLFTSLVVLGFISFSKLNFIKQTL